MKPMALNLEATVAQALTGNREALEAVVRALQDDVYGLAVRMLWHPEDAADATQEILVQVITHLSSFRGESSFRTWAFRIAANTLVRAKVKRRPELTPLDEEADAPVSEAKSPEERLLEKEVRVGCSLGMLQVLDADHRLAYVVGEVLGLSGDDAADVTGVEPATYRKRLSRARERMRGFLGLHCGVVNEAAKCCCHKRLGEARGRELLFADARTRATPSLLRHAETIADSHASLALYRSHPDFAAPEQLAVALRSLLTPSP